MLRTRLLLPLYCAFVLFAGCEIASSPVPEARGGRLDLKGIRTARSTPVALRGEWEFIRGEFMSPDEYLYWSEFEFKRAAKIEGAGPRYLRLPGDWERMAVPGASEGVGHGTFILRVSGLPVDEELGLRVGRVGAAYRLYIVPASHLELVREKRTGDAPPFRPFLHQGFADEIYSVPHFAPALGAFTVQDPELYIILHVANQDAARGGVLEPIFLGDIRRMRFHEQLWRALHHAFFGFLGALFLLHLGRLLRAVNPADVIFMLLAVTGFVYLFFLSHRAEDFFPGFSRELFYAFRRTEAVSRALFVAVWLSYPLVLRRIELPTRPVLALLWVFTSLYIGLALFASLRTALEFRDFLDPVTVGVLAYIVAGIMLRVRGGDPGGLPYLFSIVAVSGAFLFDALQPDALAGRLPFGLATAAIVAALSSNLFDGRSLGVARRWRQWIKSRRAVKAD